MMSRVMRLPYPARIAISVPLVIVAAIAMVIDGVFDALYFLWHLTPLARHSYVSGEPWPLGSLGISVTGRCGCEWAITDTPAGPVIGPRLSRF